MQQSAGHGSRPWGLIAIGVFALLIVGFVLVREARETAPVPYSTFLDQLDAGNVASVSFQGTQISAQLKHPSETSGKPQDNVTTVVPGVGDPGLISELRKQHVSIVVAAQSWTSLFERIPWPIWLFGGALLLAGLRKLFRRGTAHAEADSPQAGVPMHPMQGMMGLAAGLFANPKPGAEPQAAPKP
jgi:ATP-dependent Zn protease